MNKDVIFSWDYDLADYHAIAFKLRVLKAYAKLKARPLDPKAGFPYNPHLNRKDLKNWRPQSINCYVSNKRDGTLYHVLHKGTRTQRARVEWILCEDIDLNTFIISEPVDFDVRNIPLHGDAKIEPSDWLCLVSGLVERHLRFNRKPRTVEAQDAPDYISETLLQLLSASIAHEHQNSYQSAEVKLVCRSIYGPSYLAVLAVHHGGETHFLNVRRPAMAAWIPDNPESHIMQPLRGVADVTAVEPRTNFAVLDLLSDPMSIMQAVRNPPFNGKVFNTPVVN